MDKLKLAALGERLKLGGEKLKTGGAEFGKKFSGKMKEIIQGPTQEAKMVEEATLDSLEEPNWGLNLRICHMINSEELDGSEVVRAIKKKITSNNIVHQRLSLDLLETCAMNCDKVFSEIASEKVLDDMARLVENNQAIYANRRRAMQLIEAWGKSEDLGYLPIFRQTYMTLKDKKLNSNTADGVNSSSAYQRGFKEYNEEIPESYPLANANEEENVDFVYHGGGYSVEEKKEFLVITQNSVEILSSLLNVEAEQEPVKDDLMLSMVEKCRESEPIIQRIIESIDDDETLLFEALGLHDELQSVLAKYNVLNLNDSENVSNFVAEKETSAILVSGKEEEKMVNAEKNEGGHTQKNMGKE